MRVFRRTRTEELQDPGPEDGRGRLVAAARAGDAVALAVLRAGLDPQAVARLAALLTPVPLDAVAVLAAARTCTSEEVLEQVVLVLLDGAGRSPAVVAELLDVPLDTVLDARPTALARSGSEADAPGCRGWLLAARADELTGDEHTAARAHLESCRRC
ncbi:MAG: hypothetical protein JWM64_640, partial [Frankiales bacterium]|nr:hypothetical protein [Frankiales bacterium]